MRRDLGPLCAPDERRALEAARNLHELEAAAPHWRARMDLVTRSPGWWRGLERLEGNFEIVEMMRELDFDLHVLTKGPWSKGRAWMEKVEWCRAHLPDAEVHITGSKTGKGMVYGKLLFDDYPPYVMSWLEWRPRGLVVLPAHPWNEGFTHPNAIRWDGTPDRRREIRARLIRIRSTAR